MVQLQRRHPASLHERGCSPFSVQDIWSSHHFSPKLPGESSTNAHKNAELQLASWKRSVGIWVMPATIGTLARSGPEKRPITTAQAPQRVKNLWPCGRRLGQRLSGHIRE